MAEPDDYDDDAEKEKEDEDDYDVADQAPPPLYRGKDKETVAEVAPVSVPIYFLSGLVV